ncbi:MAG: xanthine dehydrogenase family protein subunit M, partial [Sulfolobaceae archaeon]
GGQSLIPMMKLRIIRPLHIIDIKRIPELSPSITETADYIQVSALTTHDMVANSSLIRSYAPILSEAASKIADQQIRNRGTIGGNVALGDPTTNNSIALLALDAKLIARGMNGTREIPIIKFFIDHYTTELKSDEIIERILVPKQYANYKQVFVKIARSAITWPLAMVGIVAKVRDRFIEDVKISLGAAANIPIRAYNTENFLKQKELNDENILKSLEILEREIRPFSDVHASKEYRSHLLKVLLKRGLRKIMGE